MSIKSSVEYKRAKVISVLDKRVFNICEIKEKEIGLVRKKFLYLHYDGSQWSVLLLSPDLSKVKYFELK